MTEVQKRILDVAANLFTTKSYSDVSIRHIAEEAHVSPSIIIRHFGSKDKLFLLSIKGHEQHEEIMNGPREDLGETIVKSLIDSSAKPYSAARNLGALMQALDNESLREEMRCSTHETVVEPLMKILDGPDKELRAQLVVAQITGLILHIYSLGEFNLKDSERKRLITHYGKAIQSLIDG